MRSIRAQYFSAQERYGRPTEVYVPMNFGVAVGDNDNRVVYYNREEGRCLLLGINRSRPKKLTTHNIHDCLGFGLEVGLDAKLLVHAYGVRAFNALFDYLSKALEEILGKGYLADQITVAYNLNYKAGIIVYELALRRIVRSLVDRRTTVRRILVKPDQYIKI